MKKTTLALPAESPYVDAFVSEARVSGRDVCVGSTRPDAEGTLRWNPLSFASARTALVEAENALGGAMDELALFADPPADVGPFLDASPREIEASALSWAAGHAQLIREAMRRYEARRGGTVLLVLLARPGRGPLGSMAAGALEGLAEGLLARQVPSCRFVFVRDESAQPDLLARFALKALAEPPRDAGKALRHGGKGFLFGR